MMNKKGIADPFNIGARIGYYILVIMIMSVLFMFVAVFARTNELKYYRSNLGAATINIEERALNILEFRDPITAFRYSKIIDYEKMSMYEGEFSELMGVENARSNKGVKVSLYTEKDVEIKSIKTINYAEGREDFTNSYPVIYTDNDSFKVGKVRISFWKP